MRVRVADPSADAERVAEIYRPHVVDLIISFEEVPPDGVRDGGAHSVDARVDAVAGRSR